MSDISVYTASVTAHKRRRETKLGLLRPTQPSTLSGTENEYRPKCDDDALRLESNDGYGLFHFHSIPH